MTMNAHPAIKKFSFMLGAMILAWSTLSPAFPSPSPQADALAQQAARQKVLDYQKLFNAENIKALKAQQGLTDAQIDVLKKVKALELSNDYYARLLLKSDEFKELGKQYFQTWFREGDGLIHRVLGKAKGKLSGLPPAVLDQIKLIQRQESREAMKAPMDFDVGLLSENKDEAQKILKALGGPGGVDNFHEQLEEALKNAYMELYKELGGTSSLIPDRAFFTATTAFHPEAYLDAAVLRKGVAGRDLIQQTVDVSKFKVAAMQKKVQAGTLTIEEAMTEAARGTAKDLDQVEKVFAEIERITGVKPAWTAEQEAIVSIFRQVRDSTIDIVTANARIRQITGNRMGIFEACGHLMDQMEAAWRLRKVTPQERLLALLSSYLKNEDDYTKAVRSLLEGRPQDLPDDAKRIIAELENVAKMRIVSVRGGSAASFLQDIAKEYPNLLLSSKPGDDTLVKFIEAIESGSTAEDLAAIFGSAKTEEFRKLNELIRPEIKAKIRARGANNKFLVWELDQKGRTLFGDPAGGTLAADAFIGVAMGLVQTAAILDQNLSPGQEQHEILNAWGTSLPIIGDIAQGLIEGGEFAYGGGTDKLFKSAAWIAIGLSGFYPQAQAAALIAGLGLMAYEASGIVFDVRKDKQLIDAWIASGDWDTAQGKLKSLLDERGGSHALSFQALLDGGDVGYKSGLAGTTIRDSLYLYAERNGLDKLEKLQSYLRALSALYPSFDFKKTLREPQRTGRVLFGAEVRAAGGNPTKSLEMVMFVDAKKIVDAEMARALQTFLEQVEGEYQARNTVGEAAEIYAQLRALGQRLGLPLYENVNTIFTSFSTFVTESLKSPFVRESIPRRRVQLAQRYLNGYLEIEKSLQAIRGIFDQAGVPAPSFKLSGFEEIDGPRIKDLETAYINRALRETGQDVQAIHREAAGDAKYVFNPNQPHPCDAELHKTLANIMVRIVDSEDQRLVLEQWTGKKSAAEKSRDDSLRKAQAAIGANKGLPAEILESVSTNYEAAYAWANMKWEGSQVYQEAIAVQKARLERLNKEYEAAKTKGRQQMAACLASMPDGAIQLSNANPKEGESLTAKAVLKKGQIPNGARWQWQAAGGIQLKGSAGEEVGLVARQNGTVTAILVQNEKILLQLQAAVSVKPATKPDEKTRPDEKEKPEVPTKEKPPAEKPPAEKPEEKQPGTKTPPGTSRPSELSIIAPAEVFSGERFTLSVQIPPDIADRVGSYEWFGEGRQKPVSQSGAAAVFDAVTGGDTMVIYVIVHSKDPGPFNGIGSGKTSVHFKKPDISVVSDWEKSRDGASFTRRYVRQTVPGDEKRSGGYYIVTGHWSFYFKGVTSEKGMASGGEALTLGDYQGSMSAQFENKDDSGYMRYKGKAEAELNHGSSYVQVSGEMEGQAFGDDSEVRKALLKESQLAYQEMLAGIRSLKIKYHEQGMTGGGELAVELEPEKTKMAPGEIVRIQANARGGNPPYAYAWSGNVGAGQNKSEVLFSAREPGDYKLSVTVTDGKGKTATHSVTLTTSNLAAEITMSPVNKTIVVGEKRSFSATVMAGAEKASGTFDYLWQPHPEVAFQPFEKSATTTAQFKRTGPVKVWVQVFETREGVKATVAESEQIELEVVNPKFTVSVEPKDPYVGQEVKLKVASEPAFTAPLWDYWWEISGNTMSQGPIAQNREYTYIPKDLKPITVTVHGKAKEDGADLGQANATVQAKPYEVTISEASRLGPAPRIWSEQAKGLVEVPRAIGTFQDFQVKAAITPQPANASLRYAWTVDPEGCSLMSPAGQETRGNASRGGTYNLAVTIRDGNGIFLGSGTSSVTVVEPAAEPKKTEPAKPVSKTAEALAKLKEASALAADGKLDEAIAIAEQAAAMDPASKPISSFLSQLKATKTQFAGLLDNARSLGEKGQVDEASAALAKAKELVPGSPLVAAAEAQLAGLKQKAAEAAKSGAAGKQAATQAATEHLTKAVDLANAGKLDEAAAEVAEAKKIDPANSRIPEFERWISQLRQQRDKANAAAEAKKAAAANQQAATQAAIQHLNNALELGKAGKIDEAAAEVAEAKKDDPSHSKIPEFERWINQLKQQREAANTAAEAKKAAAANQQAATQAATQHLNNALELGKAGKIDQAAAEVAEAKRDDPSHSKIPEFERWISQLRQQRDAANAAAESKKAEAAKQQADREQAQRDAARNQEAQRAAEAERARQAEEQRRKEEAQRKQAEASLAGTSWQGEINFTFPEGDRVAWPLSMAIQSDNSISGQVTMVFPGETETPKVDCQGSYNPENRNFSLSFSISVEGVNIRGRLSGAAKSSNSAEGTAILNGSGFGEAEIKGTWRLSRR